ncbi:MAG: hypothetical protein JRI23_27320 [Deltaproteobacteria bacterium]|nr:hypothetical protein [Deltaproteobacteria bacterium]MBW2535790.1 hypothetical protein [Deltaproteobacteria bacterium]
MASPEISPGGSSKKPMPRGGSCTVKDSNGPLAGGERITTGCAEDEICVCDRAAGYSCAGQCRPRGTVGEVGPQPSPTASATSPPSGTASRRADGGPRPTQAQRQVCRLGSLDMTPPGEATHARVATPCAAPLQCCYPCGMAGCDWICATPEQCRAWSTRP